MLAAQSANDSVRVGFIGVGNRGSLLLRNMLKVPGVKVVAICDIDPATLKAAIDAATAAGHSPDAYAEYRKLFDRKDIDAIVIATPADFHKEMAIASLEVGKHVYCEKPMAVTPEDCRQVTNAAGAAGAPTPNLALCEIGGWDALNAIQEELKQRRESGLRA